ncbi:Excision repair cross-complementing 1 ercc1 [Operophtera brumata]|uniref:Excision repair cross-complementing 1 ercc1 n=1 Tax=Operophtera brumata TaxID=104452 RepID=A0A0L7LFA1_OPEBR|nr:Excision repair cross-complementing 1 ercc1 [Operophtera brumata]
MDLEDGFDDLLAEISEPTSPKKAKIELQNDQPPQQGARGCLFIILCFNFQRGNPLLKFIKCVPWEFDDIIPDYEVGKTICLLFLSLRYHNMNPDYIHNRLKELGRKYDLRVLLIQVDLKDPHTPLKNLTRICLLTDVTLMLAWSPEEAAKIIENYKPVNKTDAMTLITTFGTLENIIKATENRLADCPGFGVTKAKKLYKALHEPFLKRGQVAKPETKDDEFSGDINLEEVEKLENEGKPEAQN